MMSGQSLTFAGTESCLHANNLLLCHDGKSGFTMEKVDVTCTIKTHHRSDIDQSYCPYVHLSSGALECRLPETVPVM